MARKSRKNIEVTATPEYNVELHNTAVYIRLSVEDNKKRGDSIESQKSIIENHIAITPDLKLIEIYIDNGVSGQSFERPEFKRMISDIESGKINCVIVKDLSRLGRNAIDSGYYIEKYFPMKKTRFISVNDNFDSFDSKNKNGSIIIPLKNMINEAYALDISKKIKVQAHQSMKAGDYIGGRPPYGYLKAPNNCHKLIIDEETAPVVKRIFEWVCDGVGVNAIAKRLNEQGATSPGMYSIQIAKSPSNFLVGNKIWKALKVSRIIADEVYIGNMVQGKSKSVNRKQIPVPENEWIRINNTHEPIVSHEIFDTANAIRRNIKEKYNNLEITPYTENIFKGKIFCKHCGTNLHRQKNSANSYVFHCLANDRVTIPYFKVVNVFDVAQTHGKELPTLGADELSGGVKDFDKFFEALKTVSPAPIEFEEIEGGSKGYYHHEDKRIAINENMSEVQTAKTAIHEIAHAKLHDRDLIKTNE